jgi:L,D-transpeptidase YbiS
MRIEVSIPQQTLSLIEGTQILAHFSVSTAANGEGCLKNSGCTPTGQHIIRAKIGAGAPLNTVFVGRRATGEIFSPELMAQFPNRDWILTRILWLSGTEVGVNRLGEVDTMQRYIYIHGTPDHVKLGLPGSHGCIRMRNTDLVTLFNMVPVGTPVHISGGELV